MMSKFEIVFVAKDQNFKMSRKETSLISNKYNNIDFCYVGDNTMPLALIYNDFIQRHKNANDIDWLIFMHADVNLDIIKMCEHIDSLNGKYDVIGLCGCDKIQLSISPLNWFNGSRNFPEGRWGCVTHGELGNQTSFFSQHHPEITDHEVSCIDGLCMMFSKKAINCMSFDEKFNFSHYDTDISLSAVLKQNLKLGVIIRKDLQHWSVGKSILTNEFLEAEKIFREKWKNFLN